VKCCGSVNWRNRWTCWIFLTIYLEDDFTPIQVKLIDKMTVDATQSVVLFLTDPNNQWASSVQWELEKTGGQFVAMGPSEFFNQMPMTWSFNSSLQQGKENFLVIQSQKIPFSQISGIFLDFTTIRQAEDSALNFSTRDLEYVTQEKQSNFMGLLNFFDCPVLNRPNPKLHAGFLLQRVENLQFVKKQRFTLPSMLVTASLQKACEFYNRVGQHIRVGPLTSGSQPFLAQGQEGMRKLQAIGDGRFMFLQEVPQGQPIVVTVIGNQAIGGMLKDPASEAKDALVQPWALEDSLAERCRQLAQFVHLDFCEIQLIRTSSEHVYCWDINPFPKFERYSKALHRQIVQSLRTYLQQGKGCESYDPVARFDSRSRHGQRVRTIGHETL